MKKGWYWPWLLGAGMSAIVGVNTTMLFVAGSDANGAVVEPDYYRKAVAWDSTMTLEERSAALGWRAVATLAAASAPEWHAAPRPAALTLRLSAADGTLVRGAKVQAVLIHNRDAARHVTVELREAPDGRYVGAPVLTHAGRWEVRLDAVRGDAHFVETTHLDLPAGTP